MLAAGAEELLVGYDAWRKDQSNREVDVSPAAYLNHRRAGRALVMVADTSAEAEDLALSIAEVLQVLPDGAEALRPLLARAQVLCDRVLEAAAWE